MAYDLKFKTIIDTGEIKKEIVLIVKDRDHAIEAACKIAENMGGNFLDILHLDLLE